VAAVDRIAWFVNGVSRAALRLAVAAALAGAAIVAVVAWLQQPEDSGDAIGLVVLALVLAAPPGILLLFAAGIRELAALPDRARRMPADAQAHLGELTRIAGEASARPGWRTPWTLWRLRGAAQATRGLVSFALPLRVLAPGFLAATGFAALAAVTEILLAIVALVVAAIVA
jgi:hypothetical protein